MGGELLGSMWAVVDRPVFKAPDVASLKQRGDVPELIKALRYKWYLEIGTLDGIVRRVAAARALGDIGNQRAVPALCNALWAKNDQFSSIRAVVARAVPDRARRTE
jgi:HEAT repeat protein